jgi:DNA repair exonuclease SbcCD ATPase subunit
VDVLLSNNEIEMTEDELQQEIITLEEKKNVLQRRIFKSESNEEEIGKLEMTKSNQLLDSLSARISNQLSALSRLKDEATGLTGDESELSITASIEKNNIEITNVSHLTVKLEECETELSAKTKLINSTRTALNSAGAEDISSLEREASSLTKEYSDVNADLEMKRSLLESLAEYEVYLKNVEEIRRTEDALSAKTNALKTIQSRQTSLGILSTIVKEAEVLAMEKTIETINAHAKDYLDRMFDDPICVRLESEKELKDGKSRIQLNTTIDYKGHKYDSIDELSGGEKQRCELAFLLAINDMLGSRILMLDECLNNLDSNVNTEVLTYLRELSEGKMMLVVSHEAVKGVFDSEVVIDHS